MFATARQLSICNAESSQEKLPWMVELKIEVAPLEYSWQHGQLIKSPLWMAHERANVSLQSQTSMSVATKTKAQSHFFHVVLQVCVAGFKIELGQLNNTYNVLLILPFCYSHSACFCFGCTRTRSPIPAEQAMRHVTCVHSFCFRQSADSQQLGGVWAHWFNQQLQSTHSISRRFRHLIFLTSRLNLLFSHVFLF